ncbi:hypothetical protein O181_001292 [Austropuccinia psidii MF-1]|uniref:Trafficking protein particle complex subunit 2-like protein n=1 Tax=Austropuccinia psidii MF-1 TaxID=1389203 RepID=A0A9Q3GCW3_9BASI|nr:hypothetical protein [Austropuccinia psidii MF-1]
MSRLQNLQILALGIIGKHGQPLYLRNFSSHSGGEADLKWHYAAHTSLDVFDERDALPTKFIDSYFGLLYAMEDYACYGYQTNTRIRFVLCLPMKETLVKDTEVKLVFRALHSAFLQYVSNPFYPLPIDNPNSLAPPIKSKMFDRRINEICGA